MNVETCVPDRDWEPSASVPQSPSSVAAGPPISRTQPEEPPVPLSRAEAYEVDTLIAAVVGRLSLRLRELTDLMTESVLRRVPAYAAARQGEPDNLRSSLRRLTGLLLRAFEERRRLYDEELVSLHVIAAQCARSALPLDAVTAATRVALQTAWAHVLDEVNDVGSGPVVEAVGVLSSVLFDFGQDATAALAEGYRTEAEQRTTGRLRAQATFIERVLEGRWDDDVEIRSQAHALGHELAPHCGLAVVLPGAGQDVEALRGGVARLVDRLGRAVEGPLRTAPTAHIVVLASFPAPQDWWNLVQRAADVIEAEHLLVVPTEPVAVVLDLATSYRRLCRYLPLAHGVVPGAGVAGAKELRLQAVLKGIAVQERVEFVREVLGPVLDLPRHKATELLDTLACLYRRKGRVADVAADLHLHQNSIRYRLNRIEELTGLSLDVPGDRLHLELAMRLRTLALEDLSRLDPVTPRRSGPSAEITA